MLLLILVLTTVFEVVCVLGTLPQNVTLGRTTCQCTLKTYTCAHSCTHTHLRTHTLCTIYMHLLCQCSAQYYVQNLEPEKIIKSNGWMP